MKKTILTLISAILAAAILSASAVTPVSAATVYSDNCDIIVNGVDIGYDTGDTFRHGGQKNYGWQCYGYAEYVADKVYGTYYNGNSADFNCTVVDCRVSGSELKGYLYGCAPATHVRSRAGKWSSTKQCWYAHSWSVVATYDSYLTVTEANYDWNNGIRMKDMTYDELADSLNGYSGLYRVVSYKYWTSGNTNAGAARTVPLYQTAVVTARSGLNVRSAPDINSSTVKALASNSTVRVTGYPVRDSSGYTWRRLLDGSGFVCETYLNITGGNLMASGKYRISSAAGGFLTYVTNPANDVNVVIYEDVKNDPVNAAAQEWIFTPICYYTDSGSIVYRIAPALDENYSLDCDLNDRYKFHLWQRYDNYDAQLWLVEVRPDGSLTILNNGTRLSMDIEGGGSANMTDIICWEFHGGANQTWYLVEP